MRHLGTFAPSDHVLSKNNRSHASQSRTANLMIWPEPSMFKMSVGAEDSSMFPLFPEWSVQVAGHKKTGNAFKGDVFDRIALMFSRLTKDGS